MQAYAKMREDCPELVDLVAAGATAERAAGGADQAPGGKGAKRKRIYEDHKLTADITSGIKRGILHQVSGPSLHA